MTLCVPLLAGWACIGFSQELHGHKKTMFFWKLHCFTSEKKSCRLKQVVRSIPKISLTILSLKKGKMGIPKSLYKENKKYVNNLHPDVWWCIFHGRYTVLLKFCGSGSQSVQIINYYPTIVGFSENFRQKVYKKPNTIF